MTSPAISVLLPFRDAAPTLARCLDSIAAQTFGDYEVVAVDDGSVDTSRAIVEAYARQDERVRVLHGPGDGLVGALNAGLAHCRAPLVARMDSDDAMHPERLEAQHTRLTAVPAITVLGTRVEVTSDAPLSDGFAEYVAWQNDCLSRRDIADDIYVEAPFAHPSVMFRRDAIVNAGGYRDGPFPEDYELWLRLAARGARMEKLARKLLYWHDHPQRLSRVDPRCSREAFDRLRARYLTRDRRLREGADRLCIWGAGRRTRQRCRHLLDAGFRPIAWIDIDPRKIGNRLDGVPVINPLGLKDIDRPFVLSYVASHGARAKIAHELNNMGLERGRDWLAVG